MSLGAWGLRLLGGGLTFGAVALTVHDFVGTVLTVRGRSMSPALNPPSLDEPDRVFANVWSVRANRYRRGDVVVLHSPVAGQGEVLRRGEAFGSSQRLIKRIIALPGDWVSHADNSSHMTRVPPGQCWVEGDNPAVSVDSNTFGPVPLALITARVSAVVWPYHRMRRVRPEPRPDRVFTAEPIARRAPKVFTVPHPDPHPDDAGAPDAVAPSAASSADAVVDDTAVVNAMRRAAAKHNAEVQRAEAEAAGAGATKPSPSAPVLQGSASGKAAAPPAPATSAAAGTGGGSDDRPKPQTAGAGGGGGLTVTRDGKPVSLRDRIQTIAPDDRPRS